MEFHGLSDVINLIMNLDSTLGLFIQTYGVWVYLLLFTVIFCETGLVVTPFLPGDSLIFLTGALCGAGVMNPLITFPLLVAAAIFGNICNYTVGRYLGPKILRRDDVRLFKREYLDRTHKLYEQYGSQILIYSRFMPIVRTFTPFVAGVGAMSFLRFQYYNAVGGTAWVAVFLGSGYFLGNLPIVQDNLSIVMSGIVVVSLLPGIVSFIRAKMRIAA